MSEKYHYEPGAIHNDHHKEINIGSVPQEALNDMIRHFFKDDAVDAEYEEVADDAPAEQAHPSEDKSQKEGLNYFAPGKNLKMLLSESWFKELRTDERYDTAWTEGFIDALMASEWRDEIARDWSVNGIRNKRNQIKGHVVGLLKDAQVLKGSYDSIAREAGVTDEARLFARYMSDGKKQRYADWVKDYIAKG